MKLLNIKKIIRRYEEYSTGLDYLRVSIPYSSEWVKHIENLKSIKSSINTTNSNFRVIYFKEHKVTFLRSSSLWNDTLSAILSYKWISVPILFFCEYMENRAQMFKSLGKIEVMGSFFRLIEIGYIQKNSELMQWVRDLFRGNKITRLDYRIDLFSKKEKKMININDVVKIGKRDKWQPYYIGKKSTGWTIWQRKHKRKLVRCYDKLIDTTEKWKFELYDDYFAYKTVHRIEYELLNKELEGCNWDNVSHYIAYLLGEIWLKEKNNISIRDISNIFNWNQKIEEIKDYWDYYKKTKSMMSRCIKAGINPLGMVQDCVNNLWYNQDEVNAIVDDFMQKKRFTWDNGVWLKHLESDNIED